MADAAVKPAQLVAAARFGLAVPHTLITNDAEAVRRFARQGPMVNKALGAPSVMEAARWAMAFTHVLCEADHADLRGVEIITHPGRSTLSSPRMAAGCSLSNPSGQYGWIEDAIGAPITAAIADLLVEGRPQ